jgi:L-seryl-tRNA(Ser) seleniumtransferase
VHAEARGARGASPSTAPLRPPSVDRLLSAVRGSLDPGIDREALTRLAREVQAQERDRLARGTLPRGMDELITELRARLRPASGPLPVINATGVLLHTNLGRARWAAAAVEAARRAAEDHVLLEIERESGRRGRRYREAEEHLIALTGAEDALVTNNNAAALVLAAGLAGRRGVVVSRGELIEIGGGVRIPEIVRRAGARLVEVGTTNRTRAADYEEALVAGRSALILRVHRSNFRLQGFVEDPDQGELAALARVHGVPLVDDLGSGALLDTARFGLTHEPTPAESLGAGADLVTFSGDKLLGGPQAGLVVGRAALVARLRRDPLARAMRPDKVTLAALAATLAIYRAGRALTDIPLWRSISADLSGLRERAERARLAVEGSGGAAAVVDTKATVGGGALPGETLPSVGLRLETRSVPALMARLRSSDPCVIARAERGAVLVDLRSVDPAEDEALVRVLCASLSRGAG